MPASAPASSRSPASGRSALTVAVTLTVAHLANDAYVAFLHPLLPRLMDKLGLSIAAAALLSVILSLASSLPQPVMGYLADRVGRRWLVALGPIVSGIFLSLIGLAPSFGVLVALLTLGGLGSAFFHPPAVSSCRPGIGGEGERSARLHLFVWRTPWLRDRTGHRSGHCRCLHPGGPLGGDVPRRPDAGSRPWRFFLAPCEAAFPCRRPRRGRCCARSRARSGWSSASARWGRSSSAPS